MDKLRIVLPPPIEPTPELSTEYARLAAEVGRLSALRTTAERECADLSRVAAASTDALNKSRLILRQVEIEIGQLEAEIPAWSEVADYLPGAITARRNASAVADEMVGLTRQYVQGVYYRDYPPQTYSVRLAALAHYIEQHPAVLGAIDRRAELDGNHERIAAEENEKTLRAAFTSLKRLQGALPKLRQHVAALEAEAVQRTATAAAIEAEGKRREAEAVAARDAAIAEARRRFADPQTEDNKENTEVLKRKRK